MKKNEVLCRILDANLNRAKEGLRVAEDIVRFAHLNPKAASQLKAIRHSLSGVIAKSRALKISYLLDARDVKKDAGKSPSSLENQKKNAYELFLANMARAKESIRVLEEVSKLIDQRSSFHFKKIRFKVYAFESVFAKKLETLSHH